MMRTHVGGGMGAIAATIGRRRLEPHKGSASWINIVGSYF
jgi:hypothetical protein